MMDALRIQDEFSLMNDIESSDYTWCFCRFNDGSIVLVLRAELNSDRKTMP